MSMLLAVDTSTQWMGLALYDGSQVLGESVEDKQPPYSRTGPCTG
jgi:tRNA A37 threonylcarbamoyladenosine modification protein TsaB